MASDAAQRKLTTILAADVVGYSQLMAADEEATLNTLRAYRTVTDALVAKHNGRIFNTAGDAFLAEFGSAVEAVRCAISIQEDLAVRNLQRPEEEQMWFRVGVNVGDVMIEKGDLFGDAVNVAARLEGLAEKGGICISGSTFDQVKNKLSIAFDDIGGQMVKNIPEPVPAFRLVPGTVAVKPGSGDPPSRTPPNASGLNARTVLAAGAAMIALLFGGAYFAGLLPLGTASVADRPPVAPAPVASQPPVAPAPVAPAPVASQPPVAPGPVASQPPVTPAPAHPYDGNWKVAVDSLSGCRRNDPRAFWITIKDSKFDESTGRFSKEGSVSGDGTLVVTTKSQTGEYRHSQTARIVGDEGKGKFVGRKPTCTGEITLTRMK